jgi:hypothetical protein
MIIGNGLMASAFINDYQDDDRFVIFASGVSNSLETDDSSFLREELLLGKTLAENKDKHIVYFTSFAGGRKYIEHKRHMEYIIQNSDVFYTILKLPQIIGNGGNPNNLFNYLVSNIKNNKVINVWNVYRSLIDVGDVKKIVDILIKKWSDKNTYITFPYIEKLLVKDIVYLISKALDIEPVINMTDSSEEYDLPEKTLAVDCIIKQLNIVPEGYIERIINKYIK